MKMFLMFFSLIAGVVAGNFFAGLTLLIIFAIFFLSAVLSWTFFHHKKKLNIYIASILIFIFGFIAIQNRIHPDLPAHHVSNFLDTKDNILTGRIVSFAQHYKRKQKVTLLCQTIKTKNSDIQDITGRIQLSIYGSSDRSPRYGDMIQFQSSIKSIRNFQNPGGFDYKRFLQLKGIYGSTWTGVNKIKILNSDDQINIISRLIRPIEELRINFFYYILNQTDYSRSGKIMASLITGKKEVISSDIRDLFSKAGISHLLAISGLHLSIVSLLFFSLLYRFFSFFHPLLISGKSKKIAGVLTIIPLVLYGVFTGFSPSCQRALIMIIVLIFSFIREKEKDIISSLSLAGIIILIMDSAALFSISFQLSFSAVVFIVYGTVLLKQYMPFMMGKKKWFKTGMILFITLFAGVGTSPLTAHYFNVVSIIAPISNFIAIPAIGFIVLPLGLVCLISFSWFPAFAGFIVFVCSKLISYLIIFSQFIITLPFAWSRTITLNWIEITVIYLFFISFFLFLKGSKIFFKLLSLFTILLLIVNFIIISSSQNLEKNLHITIIDVGQGSSTLIQTPQGVNIMVDGGGFSDISSFDAGRYIIAPFLWKKRVKTIDYVILTHPESDHLNGLIFILDNFNVKTLIKNSDQRDSITYESMTQICEKHNIRVYNPLDQEKSIDIGPIRLFFFDSSLKKESYNLNNNSLVFKLIYNDFSILFPGDILKLREKHLSEKNNIDLSSNILLSPHHGSFSSSSKVFLEKVHPSSVIISCGWHNRYGFPDQKVLKRYQNMGIAIYRSDENGAVFVSSDGDDYKIETFINGK